MAAYETHADRMERLAVEAEAAIAAPQKATAAAPDKTPAKDVRSPGKRIADVLYPPQEPTGAAERGPVGKGLEAGIEAFGRGMQHAAGRGEGYDQASLFRQVWDRAMGLVQATPLMVAGSAAAKTLSEGVHKEVAAGKNNEVLDAVVHALNANPTLQWAANVAAKAPGRIMDFRTWDETDEQRNKEFAEPWTKERLAEITGFIFGAKGEHALKKLITGGTPPPAGPSGGGPSGGRPSEPSAGAAMPGGAPTTPRATREAAYEAARGRHAAAAAPEGPPVKPGPKATPKEWASYFDAKNAYERAQTSKASAQVAAAQAPPEPTTTPGFKDITSPEGTVPPVAVAPGDRGGLALTPEESAAAQGLRFDTAAPAAAPDYAAALHERTMAGIGATFDPRTGQAAPYGDSFVVANTKGGAMVTPKAEFTPEKVAEFNALHAAELAEPGAFHGTWENQGNIVQDVSRRVSTVEEAQTIARSADEPQKFIWDEKNNAAIPVTTALEHYSLQQGLTSIDPSKFGTQYAGREQARAQEPGFTPRSYYYKAGTKPEARFESMSKYAAEVPTADIYDLGVDPLGLRAKHGTDVTAMETGIQEAGFSGYINSAHENPSMAGAVAVFKPLEVKPPVTTPERVGVDPPRTEAEAVPGATATEGPTPGAPVEAPATPPATAETVAKVEPRPAEAEGAGAAPQMQTIAEVHDLVRPVVEDALRERPTPEQEASIREQSKSIAQQLRAAGATKDEIGEGVRVWMNERGVLSKRQTAEAAKEARDAAAAEEVPKAAVPPEAVDPKAVQAQTDALKQELYDQKTKELTVEFQKAMEAFRKSLEDFKQKWGYYFDETGAIRPNAKIALPTEAFVALGRTLNEAKRLGAVYIVMGAKTLGAYVKKMTAEFPGIPKSIFVAMYDASKAMAETLNPSDAFLGALKPGEAMKAFRAGLGGSYFYDQAPEALAARYGKTANGLSVEQNTRKAADTYAATSNGTDAASTNNTLADTAWKQMHLPESDPGYRNGFDRPFTKADEGVYAGIRSTAILYALNQVARGEPLTGPKIGPYGETLGRTATSGPIGIVIDRWMMRLFFPEYMATVEAAGKTYRVSELQRDYINKSVNDIATSSGRAPWEVQAAMWNTAKFRREATEITASAKKHGWDEDRLLARLTDHYDKMTRPMGQMMNDHLNGAINAAVKAGDVSPTAGSDYYSRLSAAALLKGARDYSSSAQSAIIEGGGSPALAKSIVSKMVQVIKDRVNSIDPEGAEFNTAAMGVDLWRLFNKSPALKTRPYDKAGTLQAIRDHMETVPKADETLALDLRTPPTEAAKLDASTAAGAAHGAVQEILDRVSSGGVVADGELHRAVVTAALLVEKSRNADAPQAGLYGPHGRIAVKPVTDEQVSLFGERLHDAMSEGELYGKLATMTAEEQSRWLADMARTKTLPGGAEGWRQTYMTSYVASFLSNPITFVKAAVGNGISFPYTTAVMGVSEQIGKFTKDPKSLVPGSTAVYVATWMESLKDSMKLLANRDIQGFTTLLEQEGTLRLPRPNPNPETPLDSILNMTVGAPGYLLAASQAPAQLALRVAYRRLLAFNEVSRLAEADPALAGKAFDLAVHDRFMNPSDEMMQKSNDFSDTWSFTKNYAGWLTNAMQSDAARLTISPFARIEFNMMHRAVESSPLAILSPDFYRARAAGGMEWDQARAKVLLGSAVFGAAMALGASNLVDGEGPPDPQANALWRKAGHVPMTARLPGGGTVSLSWAGPFAGVLAAGSDVSRVLGHIGQDDAETLILGLSHAMGEVVTHSGILDIYAKLITAISNGMQGEQMWDMVREKVVALGLAPTVLRSWSQYLEDGKPLIVGGRSTAKSGTVASMVEKQWNKGVNDFTANLLGWSPDHPLMRDFLTGEKVQRPGLFTEVTSDSVALEIDRLGSAHRGLHSTIAAPRRTIGGSPPTEGVGGPMSLWRGIDLEGWEMDRKIQLQTQVSTLQGRSLHAALRHEIASPAYAKLTDGPEGGKAARIRAIYTALESDAEQRLLKEDKHLAWLVETNKLTQLNAQVPPNQRRAPKPEPPATVYPRPDQVRK